MFYLMRHAEASWAASTDQDRQLTERGRQDLMQLARRHQRSLQTIQKIVCSPYLRTQQTAQIIAASIGLENLVYEARLTPENSVKSAVSALEEHWCEHLLVVTHQPLIGCLINYLEHADSSMSQPVSPASIYSYAMEWPGPGCGLRESLFAV